MRTLWICLSLAVIAITAGVALAGAPGTAARLGFPVDRSGRLYLLDSNDPVGISVYSATRNVFVNQRPYATIVGSRTGLGETHALALDPAGNIYVSQGGSIVAFPPNPSAGPHDEAPSAFIVGANTRVGEPMGMAFDRSARLYVADAEYQGILVFGAHANGNVAPIATIAGSHTGLTYPQGVALDTAGNIYVSQFKPDDHENTGAEILEFAAGASGNATPIAKLAGTTTQLQAPGRISIDTNGDIYVFNDDHARAILVFAPLHAGSAESAPIASIGSPNIWLDTPTRVAIH
jgi:DNA-binding beta-propeller fold protein YncE